jgi:hypothetical protein
MGSNSLYIVRMRFALADVGERSHVSPRVSKKKRKRTVCPEVSAQAEPQELVVRAMGVPIFVVRQGLQVPYDKRNDIRDIERYFFSPVELTNSILLAIP